MQDLSKKSKQRSKSDLLKLSLTLFIIAGVMAMLVSLVNNLTAPEIARRDELKITQALKTVLPDAESFDEAEYAESFVMSDDNKKIGIDGVWIAKKAGETVGCCVKVSPQGYGGKIETIVGLDKDCKIVGTQIVSISETSGIGTKIQDESFISQFFGKTGYLTEGEGESGVQLISGATKSSKAYLRGINAAISVAAECMEVTDGE